jgi:hypothetical protein
MNTSQALGYSVVSTCRRVPQTRSASGGFKTQDLNSTKAPETLLPSAASRTRTHLHLMLSPPRRRLFIIGLVIVIMFCCTASAILSLRGGHTARAASTFFAGLAFCILFWSRIPKKAG